METRTITADEALDMVARGESHFWDFKSALSSGKVIQKIGCALADADGGEFLVGVEDAKTGFGLDRWKGFGSVAVGLRRGQVRARARRRPALTRRPA